MNDRKTVYPNLLNLLLVTPIIVLVLGQAALSVSADNPLLALLDGLVVVASWLAFVYLYVRQVQAINQLHPKQFTTQYAVISAALALPAVAGLAGDYVGLQEFGQAASAGEPLSGLYIGLTLSIAVWWLMAIGNLFYIHGKAKSNLIRLLGIIADVLIGICVAIIAFLCYSIAYSLRDPSSE